MNDNEKPIQAEKPALDDRKKSALLRYVAIMFAVAFLLVLFSLLGQMRNSMSTISELNQSSSSALQKAENLQQYNLELELENQELSMELEDLQEDKAVLEQQLADLQQQLNGADEQNAALQKDVARLQQELDNLQNQIDLQTKELEQKVDIYELLEMLAAIDSGDCSAQDAIEKFESYLG